MPSATIALLIAAAAAIAALAFALRDAQRHISTLEAHLAALGVREVDARRKLQFYAELEHGVGNPPWQTELHAARTARDEHEASDAFVDALFADERHFPHGHNTSSWELHLRENTPAAFYSDPASLPEAGPPRCLEMNTVVVAESALHAPGGLSAETRAAAKAALTDCGYVVLDNMYRRRQVDELRDAYEALKAGPDGPLFRYPVQGAGRVEHLLPFRPPFNESAALYADPRLLTILYDFLGEHVKLELMTVINSPPGSGDQRWHQGWRYLFHPEERLPPYAVVVTLPLTDVSIEMGPTEICPGKKLRLYHGWRCNQYMVKMATTQGTMSIFDYKTLHRGPGNVASVDRPMVSMVFSKAFFLNAEAVVNRGIPLVQTLHQRRYWEQFYWHPETAVEQFRV